MHSSPLCAQTAVSCRPTAPLGSARALCGKLPCANRVEGFVKHAHTCSKCRERSGMGIPAHRGETPDRLGCGGSSRRARAWLRAAGTGLRGQMSPLTGGPLVGFSPPAPWLTPRAALRGHARAGVTGARGLPGAGACPRAAVPPCPHPRTCSLGRRGSLGMCRAGRAARRARRAPGLRPPPPARCQVKPR